MKGEDHADAGKEVKIRHLMIAWLYAFLLLASIIAFKWVGRF